MRTALLLVLILAPVAAAGDDPLVAPVIVDVGQKMPDFTVNDEAGTPFRLHALEIKREEAHKAVLTRAVSYGAKAAAPLTTALAMLSGLVDEDGDLDTVLVAQFAGEAGAAFGLQATEDSVAAFETLGHVVDWIVAGASAPVLLVAWSPRCPSVRTSNDRLLEVAASTGVRMFALACNFRDQNEHYAKFRELFEFRARVLPDREQKITDMLGGTVTPQFFLLDKGFVLRYRGALDNDPMGFMDDAERHDWLLDAIEALKDGKDVPVADTEPSG